MGQQIVKEISNLKEQQEYLYHLLHDIEALEIMIKNDVFEKNISRIGAEQEFCIVNDHFRPSKNALEILEKIDDAHFTTELALFNLEINLDPLKLEGKCFSSMEKDLNKLLKKAHRAAEEVENNKIILAGILPTLKKNDLVFENITPFDRYKILNNILKNIRGSDFKLNIKGVDELIVTHDTILFEACNTSFQVHLQIDPDKIVDMFNWSQMIAGPMLAIVNNSALLMGRELWSETRIALFQQSLDDRNTSYLLRGQEARVSFGIDWVKDSILELYTDDVARYTPLLTTDFEEDSLDELKKGKIPKLKALNIFTGTIYKWNRLCYGITNGIPHFRIENRYIPSGPTVRDEIANTVFWIGLMHGMPEEYKSIYNLIPFSDAKGNFIRAARTGINTYIRWFGEDISAKKLILKKLIPIAKKGLEKVGVEKKDINKYLKVIKNRMDSGQTGSVWSVESYRVLRKDQTRDLSSINLTACLYEKQIKNIPVHKWKLVNIDDCKIIDTKKSRLEKLMSTDLFVVNENDLVLLVNRVMKWKNISHIPVVDKKNRLIGLISKSDIEHLDPEQSRTLLVRNSMIEDVITIWPKATVQNAKKKMIDNKIGCLPVVDHGNLVGIITKSDILKIYNDQSADGK